MRSTDAGSLTLPSGRIVVADPNLNPWNPPFKTTVPPGTYPVHLALGDDDVALVMVLFEEGPPTRWKRAQPSTFSVDSATGCLMDFTLARLLRRKAELGRFDRYYRMFENEMAETGLWANFTPIPTTESNIVLFHTWGGDGVFPIYFGFDDAANPMCMVIDMLLHLDDLSPKN